VDLVDDLLEIVSDQRLEQPGEAPVERRLAGSIAFAMKAAEQGAQLIRVHDVFETVQALKVWRGLRDQALTPRL